MNGWRSVAYVESPLQLLSAVEAHAHGVLGSNTDIVVRDANRQYESTVRYVERMGLPQGIRLFGARDTRWLPGHTSAQGRFTHVLGDPLSGQQQSLLLRRNYVGNLVIIDDGVSTLSVLEDLAANRPLVRPTSASSPARLALGRAMTHVIRRRAFAGKVTFFTSLPLSESVLHAAGTLDISVITHAFPWLSANILEDAHFPPQVIVGSAFAADRYITTDAYVQWIRQIASCGDAVYLPHRRQRPDVLAHISEIPSVSVARDLPLAEIALRGLGPEHHVHSLPSTSLLTLHRRFSQRGVQVTMYDIPDTWWCPSTPADLRTQLIRPVELLRIAS